MSVQEYDIADARPRVPVVRTCVRELAGSASGWFCRTLDTRSPAIALAAASELDYVGLSDALELVLLLLDTEPNRYSRAALRWHARYCAELRVDLAEAQAVLALLAALRGSRPKPAAAALAELVHRRGFERSSEALMRWAR